MSTGVICQVSTNRIFLSCGVEPKHPEPFQCANPQPALENISATSWQECSALVGPTDFRFQLARPEWRPRFFTSHPLHNPPSYVVFSSFESFTFIIALSLSFRKCLQAVSALLDLGPFLRPLRSDPLRRVFRRLRPGSPPWKGRGACTRCCR